MSEGQKKGLEESIRQLGDREYLIQRAQLLMARENDSIYRDIDFNIASCYLALAQYYQTQELIELLKQNPKT
jgi:hypothetical protein